MDALLIVLGMAMTYIYQRYRARVYKRTVRPLSYFVDMLSVAVKATDDNFSDPPVVKLTSLSNRKRLPHCMVNQSMVELVNIKKLPDGYTGQFFEYLMHDGRGSAPLWLDRLTLLPTTSAARVTLDVASTDRAQIIKFNPKLIRADLLATTINYYLGLLEK